jgi:hypothetical protein
MAEQIKDGTGKGYLVQINEYNRLLTSTVHVDLRTHISSIHAQSYTINTGSLTLSAPNTWHWVLYFKNTSTSRNLHIDRFAFNWNGGSTNFNRPLEVNNVIPLAGTPTANHTAVNPSQGNHLSANIAEMDVYKWDGVGGGMTDATGPSGGERFFSQGHSTVDWGGSIIMRLDDFVGFQVRSTEIGVFGVELEVFFVEKGHIL